MRAVAPSMWPDLFMNTALGTMSERGLIFLGLACFLFARTGSLTGLRTLAFAAALLSTGVGVVFIAFTRAMIVLIICHGIFLGFASAEMTFDGLSEPI